MGGTGAIERSRAFCLERTYWCESMTAHTHVNYLIPWLHALSRNKWMEGTSWWHSWASYGGQCKHAV